MAPAAERAFCSPCCKHHCDIFGRESETVLLYDGALFSWWLPVFLRVRTSSSTKHLVLLQLSFSLSLHDATLTTIFSSISSCSHCHLCVSSALCVRLCRCVPVLDRCSVSSHASQTVTTHTAVARVPSPTLVYSTAPPSRYTADVCARICVLASSCSARLTRLSLRFFFHLVLTCRMQLLVKR